MKKKLVAAVLTGTMLMACLTACGGSDKAAGGAAAASSAAAAASSVEEAAEAAESAASEAAESAVSEAAEAAASEAAESTAAEEPAAEAETTSDGAKEITIVYGGDPGNLSPFTSSIYTSPGLVEIYPALFYCSDRSDPEASMEPALAESWEQIDEKSYRITLKEGITDSEGNPFTANDVKYCWDYWNELGNNTSCFGDYESSEVEDDLNIILHMKTTNYGTYLNMLWCTVFTTQAAAESHDLATDPVGVGPYVLDSWTPGTSLVLKKNPNYWAADTTEPKLMQNADKITYLFLSEASQIAIGMENGEIDFANNLTSTEIDMLTGSGNFYEYRHLSDLIYGLNFNQYGDHVLNNVNIRKAIAYAIDLNGIMEAGFDSKGEVATYCGSVNTADIYDEFVNLNDNYYAYDVDKAKELMEGEGYSDSNRLKLKLMVRADGGAQEAMATVIQAYLSQIYIDVEVLSFDYSTFATYQTDYEQYDLMISLYGCFFSTDIMKFFDQNNYNGVAQNGLKSDELQGLIEAANYSTEGHNKENVVALETWLCDNMALYVFGNNDYAWVARNGVDVTTYDSCWYTFPGGWTID